MIRHAQESLDFATEGDDLREYRVIYLCDTNVSQAASKALVDWVKAGGTLVATAGGGMFDEYNRPNKRLRQLFGVEHEKFIEDEKGAIQFERQDLPFVRAMGVVETASPALNPSKFSVYGARSVFKVGNHRTAGFNNGDPAASGWKPGEGYAFYLGYLPGLSYLQPALPKRPVDRGALDESLAHLLPTKTNTDVEKGVGGYYGSPGVVSPNRQVECNLVRAKHGVVVPIINWRADPVKRLEILIDAQVPTAKITLASGRPVQTKQENGRLVCTLDLDVADALILRP
jgi:hypothetical protein